MIERYTREEMGQLWATETKFNLWLKVELAVMEVQEQLGIIPKGTFEATRGKACFNLKRIDEIEQEVKHDVIAFLTCVTEGVGESGKYLHYGLTSSDLIDTALSLQLSGASHLLLNGLKTLRETIYQRAFEHKDTLMMGRSHGIHAEPITFGFKLLGWVDELDRHIERFELASQAIKLGQITGPVGTYSGVGPEVEVEVCEKLGLKPAKTATQIIARDYHAHWINSLALLASSIEKFAVEIRHLQRTELLEVEEPFTQGQKGSSAMPHKRNPVGSENLTGLARMIRSYAQPMMENIALWHERDISHSSVERIVLPDASILMDYMLNRFTQMMQGLVVYPETMLKNLNFKGGLAFSSQVLLALVQSGIVREQAYQWVQQSAMAAWESPEGHFKNNLSQHKNIAKHLTPEQLDACFNPQSMLKHLDSVFARFKL